MGNNAKLTVKGKYGEVVFERESEYASPLDYIAKAVEVYKEIAKQAEQ